MPKKIYEILAEVSNAKLKNEKVKILRDNDSWGLKDVIRGTMDSTIKWNLPPGDPPYTPCKGHNHPSHLTKENTKFKYFAKGGPGDKLPAVKRERIFIGLIESIDPEDAKLVIAMVNKKKPKGLTRPIVEEAFPGLLKD